MKKILKNIETKITKETKKKRERENGKNMKKIRKFELIIHPFLVMYYVIKLPV